MSRTLVMSTTFPQFVGDPRGHFVVEHWRQQANLGDEVRFLAPHTLWTRGQLAGLDVRRVHYAPARHAALTGQHGILENVREAPARALWLPSLWLALDRALVEELDAWRPDHVAAHMLLPSGWIVARRCAARGVPFTLFGHGTDVDLLVRAPAPLRRRFAGWARKARCVYLPSRDKLEDARLAIGDRLPLAVETMAHTVVSTPGQPHTTPPVRSNRLLFLGRLIRQKGVDVLIQAVAASRTRPPLDVAGDGPERKRLAKLARSLGVDAHFHGFVSGERKLELIDSAAAMCVPSRALPGGLGEGAPLVILEAALRGTPVLASAMGGIPELADRAGARLVPPDEASAWAEAIDDIFAGPPACP